MNKKYNSRKNFKTMIAVAVITAAFSVGSALPVWAAPTHVEVTGPKVNIRNSASLSGTPITTVRQGQQYVYLTEKTDADGNLWYKVELSDGQQGWIMAQYSKAIGNADTITPPQDTAKQVEITGSTVNVRTGAGTSFAKVGSTVKGKTYTYLDSKKASNGQVWYQIQFTSNKTGWVMGALSKLVDTPATTTKAATTTTKTATTTTTQNTPKQVEITGSTVNVRSDAGASFSKIGSTVKGKKYTYLDSKKASNGKVWYKIQFTSSKTGWVVGSLSKLVNTPATTTTTKAAATTTTTQNTVKQVEITGSTVNVRSGAGTSSAKIGSTVKGKKYTYLASKKASNGQIWYQIQFTSNKTGWVMGSLSKLVNTSATTAATKSTTTTKTTATTQNTAKQVEITGSTVNVRSDAGSSFSKIGSTSKGKKYTYLASKKASNGQVWYQIQFTSATKGWVMGSLSKLVNTSATTTTTTAAQNTPKQVEITGNPVNVRSGAGSSFSKIGSTSKGKKYTYLDTKKDASGQVWYQIQFTSSVKGWVLGAFCKLSK